MSRKSLFIIVLSGCILFSCNKDEIYIPQEPDDVLQVPANFPPLPQQPDYPITEAGVALGRKLFFDTRLSGNNQVSCASCHVPSLAFTEGSTLSTKGISGNPLLRHVPALINLAWADNGLFWDGGSANLESQAFAPLGHKDEMFQNLDELEKDLKNDQYYPLFFQDAFDSQIRINLVMKALAQYQRTLVSANSKYDYVVRGEKDAVFNEVEERGFQLFNQKCAACHKPELFTDNDYHNNGLDEDFTDVGEDEIYLGRFRVTRNPDDIGKYKTPTLRNIAVTGPYMHDGRLDNLKAVLDFYATEIKDSKTLDPILKENGRLGVDLNEEDKKALIAFLNTLTDETFLNNEEFTEY
ncbi:cytochrome-c peroxidase [Zunongwangia endophytica]|uniref:Cytochrome-c peroxidase n=1 Tax=Zunongwangia endophytica TaxID=1808945 RepID=A0ABV8HAV4_9FLAO|nr:cytochrome c peroxidase [Zunongwangia endophytica]MDN3596666.1 cytochrome c peroxidase [Zunongwangia endophytica]